MPSSVAPNEQTVISKRTPLPAPAEAFAKSRPAQIGKSLVGQQLGQFRLEEFVGGGGMGAVFRAVDQTLDRIVAVKVVSSHQTDEDTLRRFRNEAQSAARLDHPNIARVYSVGDDQGWNYIVFEFIEGVNVRDLVTHKGPLPLDETISYVVQVAEALEHASQRDVVHRDIEPSNLLVMQDGRAKLVDMGLARLHQVESSAEDLTATGVTLGTFDYISPEQARDPRDTDVRSDLYSLGCTFYYMLTGMPPFPEGTVLQKLLSHSSEPPPDPRDMRADLPEEISAITMKLMAKLPTQRYQRPSELTAELMALCEKLGYVAPPTHGVLLPSRDSVTQQLTQHLPWLVPVCLLFTIVFGVDALLPKASTVSRAELMGLSSEPIAASEPSAGDAATPRDTQPDDSSALPTNSPSANGAEPSAESDADASRDERNPPNSDAATKSVGPSPATAMELDNPNAATAPATNLNAEPAPADATPIGPASSREVSPSTSASPLASVTANVASGRLFVIPEGPPTPNPMVVRSLEDALARAAADPAVRTIELRCDRYELEPLTLDLHDGLTIESGEGYSPLLVFDRSDASTRSEQRMMQLLGGELRLRGVHVRVIVPTISDGEWSMFHLNRVSEVNLERCTLTIQNEHGHAASFFYVQSPLAGDMPLLDSGLPAPPRPNIVLDTCVARGEATFVQATEGMPFRLDFTQGLLATTERMVELGQLAESVRQEIVRVSLKHVTAEVAFGLCRVTQRDSDGRLPQLQVDMENSLLDHNADVPLIQHIGIRDPDVTRSRALELSGQINAFPRTEILWRLETRNGEVSDVRWSDRGDSANAWDQLTLSEPFAAWVASDRRAKRVMHQATPNDYLVVDEEIGFTPAVLDALLLDAN